MSGALGGKSGTISFRDAIVSLRTAVISNKCREKSSGPICPLCVFQNLDNKTNCCSMF